MDEFQKKSVEFLEEAEEKELDIVPAKRKPLSEILFKNFKLEKYQVREIILSVVILGVAILFALIVI